jgi:hypothetical protein
MAKTRSKAEGLRYASYKAQGKQASNRKRKLLKLQKAQPNNEQITKALAMISYRRYTPKAQHWSHSAIEKAMLYKSFGKGSNAVVPKVSEKLMFSIGARAKSKGEYFWKQS